MEEFQPQTPPEPEKYEHVDAMRRAIADLFIIFDTTLDYPDKGYVRFRGRFCQTRPTATTNCGGASSSTATPRR